MRARQRWHWWEIAIVLVGTALGTGAMYLLMALIAWVSAIDCSPLC